VLYLAHFVTPYALGLVLAAKQPKHYGRYMASLVGLSYAAFLTYIAFPAAPPWMASDQGRIPPVRHITASIWHKLGGGKLNRAYGKLAPNPVAAVPSLHAAYPVLVWLVATRAFGRRVAMPLAIYPLSMGVGLVYLGEHYVFDVMLGAVYGAAAFAIGSAYPARTRT
jgi:membrane-associated phospholipid phosphatase